MSVSIICLIDALLPERRTKDIRIFAMLLDHNFAYNIISKDAFEVK